MMLALIDSAGALLRKQEFAEQPADPAGKGWRWVPVETIAATPTATQVVDGTVEALEDGKWVVRKLVRPMTEAELEALRLSHLRASDGNDMARMVEDIMVIIATSGGIALTKESFPDAVWAKINARRALRGQEPV